MSFKTLIKKKQNRLLSKTWRTMLTEREIERNNYHVTSDIHKAKHFAHDVMNYNPTQISVQKQIDPIMIYSKQFDQHFV